MDEEIEKKLEFHPDHSIDNLFKQLKTREETNIEKILRTALMERSKEELVDVLVATSASSAFFYAITMNKMFKDMKKGTYETEE